MGVIWQFNEWTLSLILIPLGCAIFLIAHKNFLIKSVFLITFFCAGAIRYTLYQKPLIAAYQKIKNSHINFTGRILDIDSNPTKKYPYTLIIQIEKLSSHQSDSSYLHNNIIKLSLKNLPSGQIGDQISCTNLYVREIDKDSYRRYLLKEGIIAHLYTVQSPNISPLATHNFISLLNYKKRKILNELKEKMSPTAYLLFNSLFLGRPVSYDKNNPDLMRKSFGVWGISHYLARSGLHVVVVILFWQLLGACLPLSFFTKQLLILIPLLAYTMLSWTSISFLRALLMFVLYKICAASSLSANALYLLLLTCIITIIYNPLYLFFIDFQLSFLLTATLCWLAELHQAHPSSFI